MRRVRKRSYAGPLQPGKRSAYVRKGPAPRALAHKAPKPRYRANLKLSKPFKAVLNKFLDGHTQTHWVTNFIRDQLPILGPTGPDGLFALIPKVTQAGVPTIGVPTGMTNNIASREGSKIRLKSLSVALTLRMDPAWHIDDPNATAIYYKVYLLSCKKIADYNQMVNAYFGAGALEDKQFRDAADSAKWDKYMENRENPINSELFTVHDMRSGTLSHGLVSNNTAADAASVRVPSAIANLHLKVKCKSKILKYEEPASTIPANFQPFLWIGWKAYNGHDWISAAGPPGLLHGVGCIRMSFDDMS